MPSKRQKTTATRARTTRRKTTSTPSQLPLSTFSTRILTNDLVLKFICNSLSPVSLVRLGRTCKQAKASVDSYISLAFNINNYLARFFGQSLVREFRSLQARTATLVAGTSALEFFARSVYQKCNLELFAYSAHGLEVTHWLQQHGFTFKPNAVADQTAELDVAYARSVKNPVAQHTAGLAGIFLFVKALPTDPSKELQIQVTVAVNAPMEVILNSYSTITLNVITWDTAYALYPRTTLEDKHALFLDSIVARDGDVTEWNPRGWTFHRYLSSVQYDSAFEVSRWIGDSQSWVLKLPTKGVTPPSAVNPSSQPFTEDPSYITSWTIEHNEGSGFPTVWTRVVEHPALFYRYMATVPLWEAVTNLANGTQGNAKFEKGITYMDQKLVELCEEIEQERSWSEWPGPQPLEGSEKESDDGYEDYNTDDLVEFYNGW